MTNFQADCLKCLAGHQCPDKRMYYTRSCEKGYFCPEGTVDAKDKPCPLGTYGPRTNLSKAEDCTACDPGAYCDSQGLSKVSGMCSSG